MSLVPMSGMLPEPAQPIGRGSGRSAQHQQTHTYTELAQAVREHRLNERTRGFYLTLFTALILALGRTAVWSHDWGAAPAFDAGVHRELAQAIAGALRGA